MAEYIEREALKVKKIYCKERHEFVVPVAEIDGIPALDLVCCGECKFYSPVEGDVGDCEREDILYLNVKKTDFCSYGVRKENE